MKLYVCWGTFTATPRPGGHPCGNAYRALKEAGHDPEVVKSYGWSVLPDALNATAGRKEAKTLTGSNQFPLILTDDGEAISESYNIVEWEMAQSAWAGA